MKRLLLSLATSTLLASCSSDTTDSTKVSQDEIHQYYSVEFNEGTQKTHAYAEFRIGGSTGTTVRLEAPSVVKFNGRDLDRRNFFGTHYVVDADGALSSNHDWEYVDNNGKTYKNSISLKAVSLADNVRNISRAAPLSLRYIAADLSADETIEAEITAVDKSTYVFASTRTPGSPVTFQLSELARLAAGPGFLTLKRTKRISLQAASPKGGSLYSQYVSKKIAIVIE